jgi:3-oxosteroid 1-dehydrogenase
MRIQARRGVLLAAGGFDHNAEMRAQHQHPAVRSEWSAGSPDNTGDAIRAGESLGAELEFMGSAWWTPTYLNPDGRSEALIAGKSMPGSIFVNRAGKRFVNEAEPYEDLVKNQFKAHSEAEQSVPCYMVCDARFRHNYLLGPIGAGKAMPDELIPADYKKAKFLNKADSLAELAALLDIDAAGLEHTVARVNEFARTGKDLDFGRGDSLHDRYYSDPSVKPNPNLGPLTEAPFYAIQICAGDLGTKGGLKADEFGRVQRADGSCIDGLYVTGNSSGAVMGDTYPGAGSTLGPAMAFGWIAAQHATGTRLS